MFLQHHCMNRSCKDYSTWIILFSKKQNDKCWLVPAFTNIYFVILLLFIENIIDRLVNNENNKQLQHYSLNRSQLPADKWLTGNVQSIPNV